MDTGTLKFLLRLESNLGAKAGQDAAMMERAFGQAGRATTQLSREQRALESAAQAAGQAGTQSTQRWYGWLDRMHAKNQAINKSLADMKSAAAAAIPGLQQAAAGLGAGAAAGTAVANKFISPFANLEEAESDLRIAMMDKEGKVGSAFAAIREEAVKLGNALPGTTKDFIAAARALKEQGTPDQVIAGGGLKASAYLGVLLGMDQYASAEMVAKSREAYALKDTELVQAADQTQRARFAFGMKPQDIQAANSYMAADLNTLKITGLENMKAVQAIQGMAAGVGLEGSSFGTNFGMMLKRMGQVDGRLNKKSKEAKEVKELLAENGISMEFFNEQGKFAGVENMVKQLEQLKPLSDVERMKVLDKMFGVEAGRPAAIIVDKGMAGYKEALGKIDSQANLDQRIEQKTSTLKSKQDALAGNVENMRASMGSQLGQALKPIMDAMTGAAGSKQGFFERNPVAGTAAVGALAIGGALLAAKAAGGLLGMLRGGAGGIGGFAAGAAGGLGGLGAIKLPLPVYVVNKQMSLTRDAMGGSPTGAPGTGGAGGAGGAAGGSKLANALRAAGSAAKGTAAIGLVIGGIDAVGVLADGENKNKGRDLARIGATTGGGIAGGALAGAALGSFLPGIGTVIGGVAGGMLGAYGAGRAFDAAMSAPKAMTQGDLRKFEMQKVEMGKGSIELNVKVSDERVSASASAVRDMPHIKLDMGPTMPAGA